MSMNYIPRVTQLDAVQLDDEVVELFKQQLNEGTKYFSPGVLSPLLPELELFLRTLLFRYSLFETKSTFGQQMLSLKYNKLTLSRSKLYWYYGYTVGFKYFKDRAFYSFTSNQGIQNFISRVERFQLIGDILNFLRFIHNGKYPTLIDYFLNMEVTADKITRNDLNDFSWTRELLWNNFIDLFGTILALTNMYKWKKKLISTFKLSRLGAKAAPEISSGPIIMDINTTCAECRKAPVLPHHMYCQHMFCYYCLKANKALDPYYACPQCGYNGDKIEKVTL